MKEINTHGLKIDMKSLIECSAYTETLYNGARVDIFYDREDGYVWGIFEPNQNDWTQYKSPTIIKICGTSRHHTPQWIANQINDVVCELKYIAEQFGVPYTDTFQ